MLIELIALILIFLSVSTSWRILRLRFILPPGPFPLPLFGNLTQLDPAKPQITCLKWSKIYGPVFTMWMGHQPTVVITDYELMKEAMIKHGDKLASRPKLAVIELFSKGNFGIASSNGELWREQRRFSLHVLRNFGLGRNLMEAKILFEAHHLVKSIRQDMGSKKEIAIDLSTSINLCIGNIISLILFGHRFEKGDQRLQLLKETLDESFTSYSSLKITLLNNFMWLRHLPIFGHFGLDERRRQNKVFFSFFATELENHKKEFESNENDDEVEPNDFLNAYLKGEDMSHFSEWQLLVTMVDLWMAAIDTTAATFLWAILAMIKYPHVQQKVHQEIDSVLGQQNLPTMADRQSMPYVMATLNEIDRWGNVTPINFVHSSDVEFKLGGYTIPKGTHVIPQVSVLAIDEKIFPSPEQFLPERFLKKDGKTLRRIEAFAPFGMGKRQCTGESLARAELFLIFVSLMQKFRFCLAPGQDEPKAEPSIARLSSVPPVYQCLITLR